MHFLLLITILINIAWSISRFVKIFTDKDVSDRVFNFLVFILQSFTVYYLAKLNTIMFH